MLSIQNYDFFFIKRCEAFFGVFLNHLKLKTVFTLKSATALEQRKLANKSCSGVLKERKAKLSSLSALNLAVTFNTTSLKLYYDVR